MRVQLLELAERLVEQAPRVQLPELVKLTRETYTTIGAIYAETDREDPKAEPLRWAVDACAIATRQADRGYGSHALMMVECTVALLDEAIGGVPCES